jgi:hypothetical protein
MRFLVVKHMDTEALAAILTQDNLGKIWFNSHSAWFEELLKGQLTRGRFFKEEKLDDRTYIKRLISTEDKDFLDFFKTKIIPPYRAYVTGEIAESSAQEALNRLWRIFSPKAPREAVEVV